jgi:hypothetical protein
MEVTIEKALTVGNLTLPETETDATHEQVLAMLYYNENWLIVRLCNHIASLEQRIIALESK